MSQIFIFLWFPSDLLVVHSFCGGELAKDVAADKDVEDDGDHKGDTEEGAGGHGAAAVLSHANCPVLQFAEKTFRYKICSAQLKLIP